MENVTQKRLLDLRRLLLHLRRDTSYIKGHTSLKMEPRKLKFFTSHIPIQRWLIQLIGNLVWSTLEEVVGIGVTWHQRQSVLDLFD
jgi:hypothetical protein